MHDAVELFLQLGSEYLNVGSGQPSFMEYWSHLERKIGDGKVAQKESMRRLNKARVALKHHGTFPSALDIESFRASTTSFFEDNTPTIFGVSIDSVSLIEYVNSDAARAKLKEAQDQISEGDTLSALDNIALAFEEMLAEYERGKRKGYGASPFFFGRDFTFLSSFFIRQNDPMVGWNDLARFVDQVKESIEAMQGAIKILAMGLDYRKYSKFRELVPTATRAMSGKWIVQRRRSGKSEPSSEDALFCLDFVVESALALAEFDYSWASK